MRLFEGTQFDIPPTCDRCGVLEEECQCPPLPPERVAPEKQHLRIGVEKRKKGKIVTVVRDVHELDLPELLTQLKNACGAGGTIKEGVIEIQGDHLDRVRELVQTAGFKLKKK